MKDNLRMQAQVNFFAELWLAAYPFIILKRIRNEEEVLRRELPGMMTTAGACGTG